jgi:hypothetical protein
LPKSGEGRQKEGIRLRTFSTFGENDLTGNFLGDQEMMSLEWTLVFALAAGWLVSMLMNSGEFDSNYFLAALVGALLIPFLAALIAHHFFHSDMAASAFAGLQSRSAGAFIACLVFDGAKRLSWR